jgi:hypothetical protein
MERCYDTALCELRGKSWSDVMIRLRVLRVNRWSDFMIRLCAYRGRTKYVMR